MPSRLPTVRSAVQSLAPAAALAWCALGAPPIAASDAHAGAGSGAVVFPSSEAAPPSVAHRWSEALLFAMRNDLARPPVHARNAYHLAAAMYDAWATFEPGATTLLLDAADHRSCRSRRALADGVAALAGPERTAARAHAIGHAAWRVLRHRYRNAAGAGRIRDHLDALAVAQGLVDPQGSVDPVAPVAHALGARVARCVIGVGRRDNANEDANHASLGYRPVNPPLNPLGDGNPDLAFPSRWQPLALARFVDQSGNPAVASEFIGADWGSVTPFALGPQDRGTVVLDGERITVHHDPGPPPRFESEPEAFARQFALVLEWSADLDPETGPLVEIRPRGRSAALAPDDRVTDPIEQLALYANQGRAVGGAVVRAAGGDAPGTAPVPLGDYTRVVAEYWADGPDSETPPGHWIRLYNEHVSMHPALERRLGGVGPALDPLSHDVIAYLALGGALHDAAIAAWSTKRAHDYVRPVSAIRWLAENVPGALPAAPGRLERVVRGGPLAGPGGMEIGAVKARAWRGPAAVRDPARDVAGVGWILARRWWPYQRPSFVTPPFAGYVSGHSAFSRAAATVLERLTGTPSWPGGGAGFTAPANAFLVFERGPSVDVRLAWATFRDAADETGLSRVWGGIHAPADDLAGRRMGARVGEAAWRRTRLLIAGTGAAPVPGAGPGPTPGRVNAAAAPATNSPTSGATAPPRAARPGRTPATGCATRPDPVVTPEGGADVALPLLFGAALLRARRTRPRESRAWRRTARAVRAVRAALTGRRSAAPA